MELQNVNHNFLKVEGLTELNKEDELTQREMKLREVNDFKLEAADYNPNSGNANTFEYINPSGTDVVPDEKPAYKPDKQHDFYRGTTRVKKNNKQLIKQSNFYYNEPAKYNVTRQRSLKEFKPNSIKYTKTLTNSKTIEIKNVVTAGCHIDPKTSYIKFRVQTSDYCNLGIGSFANIFQQTRFQTYSNDEYSFPNVNQFNVISDFWMKDREYLKSTKAKLKGYNVSDFNPLLYKTAIIPLEDLFNVFKTKQMIPPEFFNNSIFKFDLEDPVVAFQRLSTDVNPLDLSFNYIISEFSMVLDCHYIDQSLVTELHKSKIDLHYDSVQSEFYAAAGTASIELYDQNKKAYSVICKKIRTRLSQQDNWVHDAFDGSTGDTASYKFETNNAVFPEFKMDENELFLYTEQSLSPDSYRVRNSEEYIDIFNLCRNRTEDDGLPLDDRNQIRYTYYTNDTISQDFYFFKIYSEKIIVKGQEYKDHKLPDIELE
jgi:hypothetical protein